MDGWEDMQKVDYKQFPFKCTKCHEYGHFVKNCQKVSEEIPEKRQEEGWQQVKRGRRMPPPVPLSSGSEPTTSKENPQEGKEASTNNQFQALHMEEGEIPPLETISAETEEEEIHASTSIPPLSPRNERNKKAFEGSTTPRGA